MDCPFLENLKNKNINEDNSSNKKKKAGDIQNSILFKGLPKENNNLNKNEKIENNNINNEIKHIFGTYEQSLVNNYAKFLAVNANKNKMLQKKYYRNPSTIASSDIKEGESVTYDYYGVIQGQINKDINENLSNKENKNDKL